MGTAGRSSGGGTWLPFDFFLVALGLGLGVADGLTYADAVGDDVGDAVGDAEDAVAADACADGDDRGADDGDVLGLGVAVAGALVVGDEPLGAAVQAASTAALATSEAKRVTGPMWSGYVGAGVE